MKGHKHALAYTSAVVALLAAWLPFVVAWRDLPDPLATHWRIDGAPDGSLPKLVHGIVPLLASAITANAMRAVSRRTRANAAVPAWSVFIAGVLIGVNALTIWLNRGRPNWRSAGHLPLPALVALVLIPAVLGYVVHKLAPAPNESPNGKPPALVLAEGERAFWSGGAVNHWMQLLAGFTVLHAVVAVAVRHWIPAVVFLGAAVLVEASSRVRVSIDRRMVTLRFGQLGWWRQHLETSGIERASTVELEPLSHGGWGYRGSLRLFRRAAVVIRSGSALRLDLKLGRTFTVTVDDARTACELINGLLQQRTELSAKPVR
ncbi:MAG: DUF1648 domain-containing protein [Myxococcota bacterium]